MKLIGAVYQTSTGNNMTSEPDPLHLCLPRQVQSRDSPLLGSRSVAREAGPIASPIPFSETDRSHLSLLDRLQAGPSRLCSASQPQVRQPQVRQPQMSHPQVSQPQASQHGQSSSQQVQISEIDLPHVPMSHPPQYVPSPPSTISDIDFEVYQ